MSDLPTRESMTGKLNVRFFNSEQAKSIVSAYLNNELMSRAEWEATVDTTTTS